MKLLRFGPNGSEKPGLIDADGHIRDLSDKLNDINAAALDPTRLAQLAKVDASTLPLVEGTVRIGCPVSGIGKIVGIGLNYLDHAHETGMVPPDEPILFAKAVNTLTGPTDPIVLPRGSEKSDWEVELAIVIGKPALYVKQADVMDHVAGFAVINDVSERALQLEGTGQWIKGKSFPTFAPLGPWLVTPDEIDDAQNLNLWLNVNGERQQTGNTRTMIFGITHLVSYISEAMALLPGDVIATGTPPGVGAGKKPPVFLKPGDVVQAGIENLGEQRTEVLAFDREVLGF